jgi:hypothetical protein
LGALHELWKRYSDRVSFAVVYIVEIHPTDGWEVHDNRDEKIAIVQPTTLAERESVAESCAINLSIEMPVVIDELDNQIADAYGALPDRLYLIGTGGNIAFQGALGPEGFDPTALEQAIQTALT